jgi:TPP-dependent pyruvate/acetoin dehydrogenase alpha subunit
MDLSLSLRIGEKPLKQALLGFCILKQALFAPFLVDLIEESFKSNPQGFSLSELEESAKLFLEKIHSHFPPKLPFEDPVYCYPDQKAEDYLQKIGKQFHEDLTRFFRRQALKLSLTPAEQYQMLYGMKWTRALEDQGEALYFNGPEYQHVPFGGKGFKSTGQEAIVGAVLRLKRDRNGEEYQGDMVGPMIRDLGACLMMGMDPARYFYAQLGKAGPPMYGKDLHLGEFSRGVYPPTAPLAMTIQANVGMALAFKQRKEKRVVVSFIGDGATSQGEWHTAVNFAAVQKLPIVFVIEDNQIALSTWKEQQCVALQYADKGLGYGIPSGVYNGNDPEDIFAAVTEAVEWARGGGGPSFVELKTMRMSGHAFHDTSSYLVGRQQNGKLIEAPYIREDLYNRWKERDCIACYQAYLLQEKRITSEELLKMEQKIEKEASALAQEAKEAPWPEPTQIDLSVFAP